MAVYDSVCLNSLNKFWLKLLKIKHFVSSQWLLYSNIMPQNRFNYFHERKYVFIIS